jgi:DNA polymerase I-like protein with 3'-5' exonuclease and polymerase domains
LPRVSPQQRREAAGQARLDIGDQRVYYQPPAEALPRVDWCPPRLSALPSWRDARRVSIDLETKDEDLKAMGPGVRRPGNRVVGVAFAIEDGPAHYLPISHEGGDNCEGDVWGYVRDQLREFRGSLCGAGLAYDLDWMEEEGCDVLRRHDLDIRDCLVADPLINELHRSYTLESVCQRLGLPGKDESVLRAAAAAYRVHPKGGLWRLPGRFAALYAEVDARRPLEALRRQERVIDDEDLGSIWDLERRVTPIVVKMRRRGIRIDAAKVSHIEDLSLGRETEYLAQVRSLTGVSIAVGDVWKPEVLARALEKVGVRVPMTDAKRPKPSVTREFLESCQSPVARALLEARQWNKLRTTFCAQVRRFMVGDRVHCVTNQLKSTSEGEKEGGDDDEGGAGVRYGRFSMTKYNAQAQPIRNKQYGKLWRSVYVPDHGARWGCSDWSQQEPRIGVHFAEILGLPGAREFADEYRRNPALDIHQKLADLGRKERDLVKNFVNGRLYGMGDAKLCRKLGFPTVMAMRYGQEREVPGEDGRRVIDEFNGFAPWVTGLTRVAAEVAERRGYVRTVLGRKLHFERGPDGKIWKAHKAFNRVGQGSAADQMKATLVAADREGIPVQLVVHDEFDFSFTDIRQALRLKELQETTVTFNVPMKVDLEVGDSWGNLEKVA